MGDTPPSFPITEHLARWRLGDERARDELFAAVYPQLERIAARFLRRERGGHTLEPSSLVNELAVRLLAGEALSYADRAHFLAVAAQTLRRILIDHARGKGAVKRGGSPQKVSLSAIDGLVFTEPNEDAIELERALTRLEQVDPRAARVVELRFFGGMEEQEVAEVLGVSTVTVKRDWKSARAWLIARLREGSEPSPPKGSHV